MRRLEAALFAVALVHGWNAAAATLHVDTFDADTLGWGGGPLPQYVATGGAGDGGGFVMLSSGPNLAMYNNGAAWTGNLSAIGADRVNVDLMSPATSATPLAMRLVLFGPTTVNERWTSTFSQTVPNDGVWRNYTFMISPTELTHVLGVGAYEDMIVGAVRIMLRYDPGPPNSGGDFADGTLGVDNVALKSAPVEPVPGDFDGNGHVDGADLTHETLGFFARFGNDLQGNDFLAWQQNLVVPGNLSAVDSVPEPHTFGLIVLAAAAFGIRRRT